MTPFFSVIIPTYNRLPLLLEAVDSVLQQTCQDFEILIVDDDSTDGTAAHISRLCRPIRLLSCQRGGPARARNVAIREAVGKFVALLDSDDVWLPEHLAGALAIVSKYPDVGFLFADTRLIRDIGVRESYLANKPIEDVPYDADGSWRLFNRTIYPELVQEPTVITSSAMIRRQLLQDLGGFDERLTPFGEDTDLWLRVSAATSAAGNWAVSTERRKLQDGLMNSGQEFLWRSKEIELFHYHLQGPGKPYRSDIAKRVAYLYRERAIISLSRRHYLAVVADLFLSARYHLAGFPHHLSVLIARAIGHYRRSILT